MFAKLVQTSGMTKQNMQFLFFIPECSLFLFKDSANERNDKTKYVVFVFHSRVQLILFKDSANERNDKTEAELIENITIFRL